MGICPKNLAFYLKHRYRYPSPNTLFVAAPWHLWSMSSKIKWELAFDNLRFTWHKRHELDIKLNSLISSKSPWHALGLRQAKPDELVHCLFCIHPWLYVPHHVILIDPKYISKESPLLNNIFELSLRVVVFIFFWVSGFIIW